MKKALIALAVLGAASGAAMAQSSVTLYGVADIAIGKSQSQGDRKWGAESNTNVTNTNSRIGLTGKEDLGGGMWAGFRYEGAVNLATGAAGDSVGQWSREANVMVGSNSFGTVKLGRSVTPSYTGAGVWELTGWANYSVVANTFGWGAYPFPRESAQIDYRTPSFAGVSAELAYLPKADGSLMANGNGTGVANQSDRWDLNVVYAQGPVGVALTANKANKTTSNQYGNKTNWSLGGQYKFNNMFALAVSYNRANYAQAWRNGAYGNRVFGKRYGWELGGSFFTGPFTVTLDLTRDTSNTLYAGKKYTNGLLEGKYSLSKRTFLYADYLRLDSTNNYGIGIRHNF
jgi:predicted porin